MGYRRKAPKLNGGISMKKFLSLFLTLALLCALLPSAAASTIYTAKEIKVKPDFQTEGVDDGKGSVTYVDVEGGSYISPWKYDVENISLTVIYKGEDYKVKTKDLELEGLKDEKSASLSFSTSCKISRRVSGRIFFGLSKKEKHSFNGKEGCVRETQEGFPALFQ